MTTLQHPPAPPQAPTSGPDSSLRRRNRARHTTSAIIARAILIAVSLLFLVPLYWMVVTAFKSDEELAEFPPSLLPDRWDLSIFPETVAAFPFWTMFGNSLLVTGLGTVLAVLSSYVVAYGFACIDWPGRDKVFYLVLATIFIPFPIAIIPLFDLFAALGWVNTLLPLIVPNALGSAFYIFLLRQFLLQASTEVIDAARVDGASEWRTCWQVVLPTARGALIAVGIFAAVASWNDFLGPLIYLQDPSIQTLAIGLQTFSTDVDSEFNQLMAASTLTVLPMVVLFIFFQRYFVRGLNVGGFR